MKASETESKAFRPRPDIYADSVKLNHAGRFTPVLDSRNRRVPGLSQRNGRFYGQLWVERANGTKAARRFPLTVDGRPVETITEAKEAMEILRHQRREEKLPTDGRKPTFAETAAAYLESGDTNQKKPRTRKEEGYAIDRLKSVFGAVRIDKVTPALAAAYKDARLKGKGPAATRGRPAGPVAVNHDLIVLRNVLKYAVEREHIRDVPAIKLIKDLPEPARRSLISDADFNRLVDACMVPSMKNGRQLADFLKFLAFTGAREQEALAVGWGSVDFDRETVSIGAGDTSKNRETRLVDFNPALAALLADMKTRRPPDSSWLFPSPQRGAKDIHARRLRESLKLARAAAGLSHVGFHHLRVLFISRCVMAGIDYLTIAGWVGHKDGGVLIGRTYGRLRDEHKKAMAAKLGEAFGG